MEALIGIAAIFSTFTVLCFISDVLLKKLDDWSDPE